MLRMTITRALLTGVALLFAPGCGGSGSTQPPVVAELEPVVGDEQSGAAGAALTIDPVVRAVDASGRSVASASITFTVTAGGGATTDTTVVADAQGRASTTWFLGPQPAAASRLRASSGSAQVELTADAGRPASGATYFGRNQYIESISGDLPIIISAPHGGTLVPEEIPDRTSGTTVRDLNTEELARLVGDTLEARTGARPHLVITRLRRTKLDANREIVEAAQGNEHAGRAWFEYHAFLEAARAIVTAEHGAGLYVDLHGHGHTIQRIELGYLLTASDLALSDDALDQPAYVQKSSVRALVQTREIPLSTLMRGAGSFGEMLVSRGYPAVPSPSDPTPGSAPYFNGGYNTVRYGSRNGGTISGVQIELNSIGVRDTQANREAFASALADVLLQFVEQAVGVEVGAAVR